MVHHIVPLPLPIQTERIDPVRPRRARLRDTRQAEWADEAVSEDEAIDAVSEIDGEPRRRFRRRPDGTRLRPQVTTAAQTLSDETLRALLVVQEVPPSEA